MDLAAVLLGFAGFMALSVPAFHLHKYGRLLAKLASLQPITSNLEPAHRAAEKDLKKHRDSWRPWKGWCLLGGTASVTFSYAMQLAKILLRW